MSQGQDAGQALQSLSQQLQELDAVQEQLEAQLEAVQTQKSEVNSAIDTLDELESGSTVQVPLGGDAYVKADIPDVDEIIVSLGAEFAAERSRDGAIDALEQRIENLDEQIETIQENLSEVASDIEEVEGQAQQVRQQMAQQQTQQLGGLGGEDI